MKKILCYLGFHDWEISKEVTVRGKLVNYFRECLNCGKEQRLAEPKYYHPSKYVWTDIQEKEKNKTKTL